MIFLETETVELKEIYTAEIKKEIVAFANTRGGTIYIGIKDDGEIIGVENVDFVMQQIANSIRDSIKPDVLMFTRIELINEDKKYIKISIMQGTKKPYYLSDKGIKPSGVFVRSGTTSAPASEYAIRNMIKISDGYSFENGYSMQQDLTFDCLKKEMNIRNMNFEDIQMKNLGIISNQNFYTNMGLIVSDQCQNTIKFAIFQGTDKLVFKSRKEFTGSVFHQLTDVYKTIDFYNGTRATFKDLLRIDQRDYPVDAVREALLNAIVHKDYSFSGSTFINLYADRLEIISLGGLVEGLSIEAAMLGASQPRNKNLADLFYRMKLIEAYGTGISKIISCYKESVVKPQFNNVQGAFQVILPNINYKILKSDNPKIMDVLSIFNDKKEVTRIDIEQKLNSGTTTAVNIIKEMIEQDLIIKIGSGKKTSYIINFEKE